MLEVIIEAMHRHFKQVTLNSDQAPQFTSDFYLKLLTDNEIDISMDGKGRYIDTSSIECHWRRVKYV